MQGLQMIGTKASLMRSSGRGGVLALPRWLAHDRLFPTRGDHSEDNAMDPDARSSVNDEPLKEREQQDSHLNARPAPAEESTTNHGVQFQ